MTMTWCIRHKKEMTHIFRKSSKIQMPFFLLKKTTIVGISLYVHGYLYNFCCRFEVQVLVNNAKDIIFSRGGYSTTSCTWLKLSAPIACIHIHTRLILDKLKFKNVRLLVIRLPSIVYGVVDLALFCIGFKMLNITKSVHLMCFPVMGVPITWINQLSIENIQHTILHLQKLGFWQICHKI